MENKFTKGQWILGEKSGNGETTRIFQGEKSIIADCYSTMEARSVEEAGANAKLMTEAGNVANETGKTPRQLADHNEELLEALNSLLTHHTAENMTIASELIKKHQA